MSRKCQSFGASVRGPLHKRNRELNQDAWLSSSGVFGSLIVVCDDLGSKPKSRLGAKAACHAVREAAIRWAKVDGAPLSYLSKLVNINWALRIHRCKCVANFPKDHSKSLFTGRDFPLCVFLGSVAINPLPG